MIVIRCDVCKTSFDKVDRVLHVACLAVPLEKRVKHICNPCLLGLENLWRDERVRVLDALWKRCVSKADVTALRMLNKRKKDND